MITPTNPSFLFDSGYERSQRLQKRPHNKFDGWGPPPMPHDREGHNTRPPPQSAAIALVAR